MTPSIFLFGRGKAVVDNEGLLKVPKPKPADLTERDHHKMYRARVLKGDLPLVPVGPIFWGALVSVGDDEPVGVFDVEVDGVEEFIEDVMPVLAEDLRESMVRDMVEEMSLDLCFEEDVVDAWELHRR